MVAAILHGFILAFGLILPLGAQNVFVFNQGAGQRTFVRALPVVITASLCDTVLIAAAVLGVSVVILTVQWLQLVLLGGGFLFLLYMGWAVWKSAPASLQEARPALDSRRQIAFALSVSLLNPHAILDTIGVIGTSSLQYVGKEKFVFAVSCILVSWLWFFGLAFAGHLAGRQERSAAWLALLNKLSALVIWGVAIYIAITFLQGI